MSELINRIPSVEFSALFPGVANNLELTVSSHLFSFRAEEMPILMPYEQLVVAALVCHSKPRRVLEFGTAQGQTTLALAANSPPEAEVFTVDLSRESWSEYTAKCLRGDTDVGSCYRNSPWAGKVRQLYRTTRPGVPSMLKDLTGSFDFIHVDGDHSYDGVRADSVAAIELASETGLITWHDFYMFPDYLREGPQKRGVFPFLNELSRQGEWQLRHIVGTYLVVGSRRRFHSTKGTVVQPGEVSAPFGQRIVRLAASGSVRGNKAP